MCGIRRTMRYLITVTENISLLLGRDRRHRKLWRREGGAGGVPTNTRGRAPRVPETSTAMSDDDEVTEEVLARLSREMAETVRVSLRQGEPEAVVDSQVAGEDDAPGPRTSAVSWSSRENPDDDDIMISALVSAMAKGREISASLGGGTDPVRVMVNLDAAEPPNPSGSRSSSVQRERVGFGSSAPRVTAPKVPSDADVTGPGLAYANVENLSRVSRPNAPGARWGKPPPRRPALAESLAPSSTRRAAARAVSAVTGAAHGTGGVAEAIADLEWVVRGEAGSSQPALVSPERLDVARRKPKAVTFSKAGLRPVTPPGERARARREARAAVEEDLRARGLRELPPDERFRAVERTPGRLAKFSALPTGRDAGDESTSSSEGTGSEYELDDDADAWWNAPFGTLTFAEGLMRTPRKVKKRAPRTGDEKENATGNGTKRRTKTAVFASPAKPGRSKPDEPEKGATTTRGDKRQPPPGASMLDPVALARALDVTRAKSIGARGVTRWAPPSAAALPSPPGSVASMESTESDDWHGRNIRRDLRRRASAERAAIARTTAADTDMNAVRPRNVTGVTKWGKPPPAPDERRAEKEKPRGFKDGESYENAARDHKLGRETAAGLPLDVQLAAGLQLRPTEPKPYHPDGDATNKNLPPLPDDAAVRKRVPGYTFPKPKPLDEDLDEISKLKKARRKEELETPGPGHYANHTPRVETRPKAPAISFGDHPIVPVEVRQSMKIDLADFHPSDLDPVAAWHKLRGTEPKGFATFWKHPEKKSHIDEVIEKVERVEAERHAGRIEHAVSKALRQSRTKDWKMNEDIGALGDAIAAAAARVDEEQSPDANRSLVERRVDVGGAWARAGAEKPDGSEEEHAFDYDAAIAEEAERRRDPVGAWKASVAPSKPVFSFPKGPSGREDVDAELEPWPVLGIGEPWSERRVEGGALPFELVLGRSDAYEDRLKAREAEEKRKIFPGSYDVVAALDYLRRQTPAAIFKLAADRWRAHGRARRLKRARNLLGADVAGYMADEWDDDERDEDEGPAMLGDEARAAADALMRPRAPAWEFLPLRVTVAKANVATGMKPGDRPELDVKLTLVRRRQPGATKFGSRTPSGSKKSNARTRDEADAARRGPGAYRLRYGQTERRAPRAVIGTSGLGDDAVMEDDEEAYAEQVLDIDPAAAFAAAVAPRKGTAVDMRRMPHPRVDDAERARRREELDLAELTERPKVETPLEAFRAPDGRGGWSALMDVSPAASRRRRLAEERRAKMEGISEVDGPDSSPTENRMRAKDKLTDPSSDAYVRRRTDAGVMDFASMTFRVSERTPGNVELDLLEAGIGPGTYAAEPASRRRVPEVDFARGAARFALTDAEKAPPDEPLEGERVAIETGPAFDATRPDATRGGVISPLPTRAESSKGKDGTYADALYDVERGLRYMRSARDDVAPAFERGGPRVTDPALPDPRSNPDAPDFYAGDLDERGRSTATGESTRHRARGWMGGWKVAPAPPEFTEGDILYLDPARADDYRRRRTIGNVPDLGAGGARETPGGAFTKDSGPALTRDVDYVRDDALRSAYPPLVTGTGAVRVDRGRAGASDIFVRQTDAGDLDAGAYHDESNCAETQSRLSNRERARAVDFSNAPGRRGAAAGGFGTPNDDGGGGEGDVLVLDPIDPKTAPMGRGTDDANPAVDYARDRTRRAFPAPSPANPGGDVLHLQPGRGDALGERARKADFGAGPGRGSHPGGTFGEWTDANVIHGLRAEVDLDKTAGGLGDANARRRERMARLVARQPRRGRGDQRPEPERPGKIVIA